MEQLGLRLLEHQEVDLILVDIFMPDMDGLEVILRLRESRCASKMIAITGRSGMKNFLDIAKHLGAHDTLMKPFSVQELLDAVSSQLTGAHSRLSSLRPNIYPNETSGGVSPTPRLVV